MATNTRSRPSVRSIRSSAVRSNEGTTRYVPEERAAPVGREISREDAEAIVRKQNPNLFRSREQIFEDARKIAAARFGAGSKKYNAEVEYLVKSAERNDRYNRNALIDDTAKKMQADADRQYERELAEARAESERAAAAERLRVQKEQATARDIVEKRGNVSTVKGRFAKDKKSEEERKNLNFLEAQARMQIANDPDDRSRFTQIIDFDEAVDDDEAKRLMDVARDSIDQYYTDRENETKARLALNLKKLNENFKLYSQESQFLLETAVGKIDRDTAESLLEGINDAQTRGILDSGLLLSSAKKIVEAHERSTDFEERTTEFGMLKQTLARDLGIEEANLIQKESLGELERDRREEEYKRFFDLSTSKEDELFNQQAESATRLNPEQPEGTAATTARTTTSNAARLPSVTAKTGTSLDLARQAQADNWSLDEQRRAREALLSAPQPTKPAPRPQPTLNQTARNIITASTPAGQRLQQRAAERAATRSRR